MKLRNALLMLSLGVAPLAAAGCAALAVGAAAGAGTAIYATNRGQESVVPASMDKTADAARAAFAQYGIDETSYQIEKDGSKRTLEGKARNRDVKVTVTMEQRAKDQTHVEVTSAENLVTYDKEFSKNILGYIVERATGKKPAEPTTSNATGSGALAGATR
jgi:hypothetical protein